MKLEEAQKIAQKYLELLKPYCQRIKIAGSIRRQKPEVKDIEIVCIPTEREGYRDINFAVMVNKWFKSKGTPFGRYTQRFLPEGIKLDLFMANENNWGLIFAIRTGSAEFSHKVLACGWVKKGYHSKGGKLTDEKGREIILREEESLFDVIGIPYIEPKLRF